MLLRPFPLPVPPNLHTAFRIPFALPRPRNPVHPQAPLVRTCRLRRSTWVQKAGGCHHFWGKNRFSRFLPPFHPSFPYVKATLLLVRGDGGLQSQFRRAYFVRVLPHSLRLAFELFL